MPSNFIFIFSADMNKPMNHKKAITDSSDRISGVIFSGLLKMLTFLKIELQYFFNSESFSVNKMRTFAKKRGELIKV